MDDIPRILLWTIPLALGFLWLMRRGACGGRAYGAGTSRTQGVGPDRPRTDDPVDPVCGMEVDLGRVAGTRSFGGREYSFCSPRCIEVFDENPPAYAHPAGEGEPARRRHGCC